jgi:hypothetical protein
MINWFSVLSHIKTIYVSEPGQSEMQAKSEAARQGKWLLVNLQSTREFSSYMVSMDPVLTSLLDMQKLAGTISMFLHYGPVWWLIC